MPTDGIGRTFLGPKLMITELGGIAVKLTNKTGVTTTKGYICESSSTTASAFAYCDAADCVDPIGVVYGDDEGNQVSDGVECWVVVSGIAEVYFGGDVDLKDFCRTPVAADSFSAGQAAAEAAPSSPFATDKHFQEIGHAIESRVGAGLAKIILHFN